MMHNRAVYSVDIRLASPPEIFVLTTVSAYLLPFLFFLTLLLKRFITFPGKRIRAVAPHSKAWGLGRRLRLGHLLAMNTIYSCNNSAG